MIFILLLVSFPLWLPVCGNAIFSHFFQKKYSDLKFRIQSVGLDSVVLSKLELRYQTYGMKIERVLVDLNWWDLIQDRHLDRITVLKLQLQEFNQTKSQIEPWETVEAKDAVQPAELEPSLPFVINEIILLDTVLKHPSKGAFKIPEIQGELTDQRVVANLTLPFLNQELEFIISCRYLDPGYPYEISVLCGSGSNQLPTRFLEASGDLAHLDLESNLFEKPLRLKWRDEQSLEMKLNFDQFGSAKIDLENVELSLSREPGSVLQCRVKGDAAKYAGMQLKSFEMMCPLEASDLKGYLKGQFEKKIIGSVNFNFEIIHQNKKLELHGDYSIPKLGLGNLPFELAIDYSKKHRIPEFEVKSIFEERELNVFTEEFQLLEGHLSAKLSASIQMSYHVDSGLSESVALECENGFFASADFSTTMNGIEMKMHSDQIFSMNTGPSQIFTWKSFKSQGMEFVDGKIFWQWERQQKLFIESLKLGWCKGTLSLLPIRLDETRNDFDFTFFCERVELAEVLKSFKVGEVEGEGELGGKISFSFKHGKWRFADTYLYSDPAKEGRLLIKEAQMLDQAMGQSQLQLARESLKDYKYKWAKINFVSENDNLVLKLVMDGKPNGLLPFRFDPESAQFIYDKSSPGVDLKGLKLNTNFRSEQFMPLLERSLNFLKKIELK